MGETNDCEGEPVPESAVLSVEKEDFGTKGHFTLVKRIPDSLTTDGGSDGWQVKRRHTVV